MSTPVVAIISAKHGKETELEALLVRMVESTHEEAGCQRYALHRSKSDPRTFVFIEKWTTDAALDAHAASPHVTQGMLRKVDLIERLEIIPLTGLPAGDLEKGLF
jgi:quinol monooxygenase YgiN